jgi:hypothetical protein
MKMRMVIHETKEFSNFRFIKGTLSYQDNVISFNISCDYNHKHHLRVRKKNSKYKLVDIPEFKVNQLSDLIIWIGKNFNNIEKNV